MPGGDADPHARVRLVVARHEQDVAARLLERGLVDAGGAHPEPRRVLAGGEVAVREAADLVEPHHVAEVALVEELVHRERRRQEVELAHPLAGSADVGRDLVTVPELGLEVRDELVVDHELRLRERREPLEHLGRVVGDLVGAALHRREPDALAGHVEDDDVRERPDEVRVARAQHVVRHLVELVERGRVGPARRAPERLRILRVEHVEDEVGVGVIVDELEAVRLERLADGADPLPRGTARSTCPRSHTCA